MSSPDESILSAEGEEEEYAIGDIEKKKKKKKRRSKVEGDEGKKKRHSKTKHHKRKSADPEGIMTDSQVQYPTYSPPPPSPRSSKKHASVDPDGTNVSELAYMAAKEVKQEEGGNVSDDKIEKVGQEESKAKNNDAAEKKDKKDTELAPDPLATFSETFSFAQTAKIKVCIAVGE